MEDLRREANGERLRLFWAIELPEPARTAAGALLDALRDRPGSNAVRWVREESLHVTLRFLGDVAPDRVPALLGGVAEPVGAISPFEFRLGVLQRFPSARKPQMIVLAVQPPEPLEALAAAVERGVTAAGFEPESRPFRPHLTLGRVRPRKRAPDVTGPDTAAAEAIQVTEAVLFRSELHPSGARYTPLGHAPLGVH